MTVGHSSEGLERAGTREGVGKRSPRPASGWQTQLTIARVAFDSAVILVATVLAFLLRFGLGWFEVTEESLFNFSSHLTASLVWLVALLGALALNRLYDDDTLFPGAGELSRVLRSVMESVAVLSVFVYFTHSFSVSRSWFALTAILSAVFLGAERIAVRAALKRERLRGRFRRPVVLVSREGGRQLESTVGAVPEFHVVDRVALEEVGDVVTGTRGRGYDLVVAASDFGDAELWDLVIRAGQSGRSVFLHSSVRSVSRYRLAVRDVGDRELMKVSPPYLTGPRAFRKRAFDLVVGGALLIGLLPVMVIIAIATLITTGPPIFFRQERVGKDGKSFRIWKFRSMRLGTTEHADVRLTAEDDPRRTRLGKFLRRTSLDELPQLWNVLAGEMSLVGPRPLWRAETEDAAFAKRFTRPTDLYQYRYRMRPGMTGWAQVHGLRGRTQLDPWVDHDNWYIENWSHALDIKILVKTLGEIIRGHNAD